MTVAVMHDIPLDDISQALPPKYRGAPLPVGLDAGVYTVLVLETGQVVVSSQLLKRALRKAKIILSAPAHLVVCGYDFTADVREAIAQVGAVAVSERDFHWTDERYRAIRQPKSHEKDDDPKR